jgi:hypothetical protein
MDSLIEQAIQRAIMGFPPGSSGQEPESMMWFEFALERALLGMPSAPLQAPPRYDFLLYRQQPTPSWMEE